MDTDASDTYWMQQALARAEEAKALGEVPVGAVVVANDEMIGAGYNRPLTDQDPTSHAEIVALRAACRQQSNYRLPGAHVYVTIEPCTMCVGALVHARIERLVFAAREPRSGAVVSRARLFELEGLNHRVSVSEGVCAEASAELIKEFFRSKR